MDSQKLSQAFQILQMPPSTDAVFIRRQYHNLAKIYHPDITSVPQETAEQKMAEINSAYLLILKEIKKEDGSEPVSAMKKETRNDCFPILSRYLEIREKLKTGIPKYKYEREMSAYLSSFTQRIFLDNVTASFVAMHREIALYPIDLHKPVIREPLYKNKPGGRYFSYTEMISNEDRTAFRLYQKSMDIYDKVLNLLVNRRYNTARVANNNDMRVIFDLLEDKHIINSQILEEKYSGSEYCRYGKKLTEAMEYLRIILLNSLD